MFLTILWMDWNLETQMIPILELVLDSTFILEVISVKRK